MQVAEAYLTTTPMQLRTGSGFLIVLQPLTILVLLEPRTSLGGQAGNHLPETGIIATEIRA
jgi:hypothetical protein